MDYLFLLRSPGFFRLLFGSWIGRLPSAMAAVAIPLVLRDAGASFGFVGAAAGMFAIAAALGSPVVGRLVDRVGQPRVLAPTALLATLGFVAIAAAPEQRWLVLVGAAVAGVATPPLEPCLRVLWPDIVPRDRLEGAYAVDSAAQELVFVAGPLVVAICVAVVSPVAALWTMAVLCVVGVVVFATAAASRRWRPVARSTDWVGPLRSRGLVVLLVALAGAGFAIGTLNVLVVSYAERFDVPGGAPVLLTLHATASLVGVLVVGAIRWRVPLNVRAVWFAGGLVVGYGLLTTVPAPVFMAALMLVTGLFLAPLLATTFALIGELAPRGTATEAFAWLVTLFAAGVSIGSAVVGMVLDRTNLHWAAACGVAGVLSCLVLLTAGNRLLATATATDAPDAVDSDARSPDARSPDARSPDARSPDARSSDAVTTDG